MKQEIRFCRTPDGVRLAYALAGNGPPLVKAANWLSHIEYEWDRPVWRHWYEALAERYTLIRYDQRGCGLSDRQVDTISFDAWVQDLETIVNTLGLKRFPLLGISQGGSVAAAYAGRHSEKVSHLILYGSYLRGRLKRDMSRKEREETSMLIKLIQMGWGSENPAFRQVFTTLFLPDATLEQIQSLNQHHKDSTSAENAVRIVSCFDRIDVTSLAPEISTPTLILHARDDARIPFEEGRLAAALIPDARFLPLKSRNHILLETEPAWQEFLTAVLKFTGSAAAGDETALFQALLSELTFRERDVLELVAQGLSNQQIADRLFISPKTVRNHITNIFGKLDIKSRPKAIVMARKAGLGHNSKG